LTADMSACDCCGAEGFRLTGGRCDGCAERRLSEPGRDINLDELIHALGELHLNEDDDGTAHVLMDAMLVVKRARTALGVIDSWDEEFPGAAVQLGNAVAWALTAGNAPKGSQS
jgi:hypothetical protein